MRGFFDTYALIDGQWAFRDRQVAADPAAAVARARALVQGGAASGVRVVQEVLDGASGEFLETLLFEEHAGGSAESLSAGVAEDDGGLPLAHTLGPEAAGKRHRNPLGRNLLRRRSRKPARNAAEPRDNGRTTDFEAEPAAVDDMTDEALHIQAHIASRNPSRTADPDPRRPRSPQSAADQTPADQTPAQATRNRRDGRRPTGPTKSRDGNGSGEGSAPSARRRKVRGRKRRGAMVATGFLLPATLATGAVAAHPDLVAETLAAVMVDPNVVGGLLVGLAGCAGLGWLYGVNRRLRLARADQQARRQMFTPSDFSAPAPPLPDPDRQDGAPERDSEPETAPDPFQAALNDHIAAATPSDTRAADWATDPHGPGASAFAADEPGDEQPDSRVWVAEDADWHAPPGEEPGSMPMAEADLAPWETASNPDEVVAEDGRRGLGRPEPIGPDEIWEDEGGQPEVSGSPLSAQPISADPEPIVADASEPRSAGPASRGDADPSSRRPGPDAYIPPAPYSRADGRAMDADPFEGPDLDMTPIDLDAVIGPDSLEGSPDTADVLPFGPPRWSPAAPEDEGDPTGHDEWDDAPEPDPHAVAEEAEGAVDIRHDDSDWAAPVAEGVVVEFDQAPMAVEDTPLDLAPFRDGAASKQAAEPPASAASRRSGELAEDRTAAPESSLPSKADSRPEPGPDRAAAVEALSTRPSVPPRADSDVASRTVMQFLAGALNHASQAGVLGGRGGFDAETRRGCALFFAGALSIYVQDKAIGRMRSRSILDTGLHLLFGSSDEAECFAETLEASLSDPRALAMHRAGVHAMAQWMDERRGDPAPAYRELVHGLQEWRRPDRSEGTVIVGLCTAAIPDTAGRLSRHDPQRAHRVAALHDELARAAIRYQKGQSASRGKGMIFSTFELPASGLTAAIAIMRAVRLHNQSHPDDKVICAASVGVATALGEDLEGTRKRLRDEVSGLCADAQPGEIVVTRALRRAVQYEPFSFAERAAVAARPGSSGRPRTYLLDWNPEDSATRTAAE